MQYKTFTVQLSLGQQPSNMSLLCRVEREGETQRQRQKDRQTDRHTDTQTDR